MANDAAAIGRRIAHARERNDLTQRDLAATAGLERSALAKIERGHRGISALELAAVAQALDMRIEWLLSDGPPALASHRAKGDAEAELTSIDGKLERLARDVEMLASLDPTLLSGSAEPVAVPRNGTEAEELAEQVRHTGDLGVDSPIADLDALASDLGLLAFAHPLGAQTADAASTLLERGGVALINSTLAVGRRRLALAHELGHYLVADEYTIDWHVSDLADADHVETLLDRFARSLLAPRAGLARFWKDARENHDLRTRAVLAASHYRIDMSTLARRVLELDLEPADESATIRGFRTTKADIIDHGLVVSYDLSEVTLPRRYEKSVLNAYRNERVSEQRALSLLHGTFDPEDLPPVLRHPNEIWSAIS